MKYCPYCGTELLDEVASFCTECGKPMPDRNAREAKVDPAPAGQPEETIQTGSAEEELHNEAYHEEQSEQDPNAGYDGYYDDVLPDDSGDIRTGVDNQLVKKIVVLVVSVALIIGACVAIMYIL